jgi:hypothetical protein
MIAKVEQFHGRPAITIDGVPYPPMMATVRTMTLCDDPMGQRILFDRDYFAALGKAGIRIFFLICDTLWLKPDAIELFDTELGKRLFRGCNDVFLGKIISAGTDAALGLDDHLVPEAAGNGLAEHLFAGATAVNVGMIKEVRAMLQSGLNKLSFKADNAAELKLACDNWQLPYPDGWKKSGNEYSLNLLSEFSTIWPNWHIEGVYVNQGGIQQPAHQTAGSTYCSTLRQITPTTATR